MAQQRHRDAGSARAPQHRERVRAVVEPVVAAAGYDLEDLSIQRVGRRHLVRVAVDSDAGVDLDAVAELSRRISAGLDEVEAGGEELIAGEYELEVGSRGVDRPLTEPRHWRRNAGRLVRVRADGQELTSRIKAADDAGVVLEAGRFTFAQLGPGRVEV